MRALFYKMILPAALLCSSMRPAPGISITHDRTCNWVTVYVAVPLTNSMVQLYDPNGLLLQQRKLKPQAGADASLDLTRYKSGAYLVCVVSGKAMVTSRVVIRP
jgi:hypothetical protein